MEGSLQRIECEKKRRVRRLSPTAHDKQPTLIEPLTPILIHTPGNMAGVKSRATQLPPQPSVAAHTPSRAAPRLVCPGRLCSGRPSQWRRRQCALPVNQTRAGCEMLYLERGVGCCTFSIVEQRTHFLTTVTGCIDCRPVVTRREGTEG